MKSSMRKIIVSICMAFAFACAAVVSGVMLLMSSKSSASKAAPLADSSCASSVTLTVNGESELSVSPGTQVTIRATYTTTREDSYWFSIATTLYAYDTADATKDVMSYISFPSGYDPGEYNEEYVPAEIQTPFKYYNFILANNLDKSNSDTVRGITIALQHGTSTKYTEANIPCYFEFDLVISEDIKEELGTESITFAYKPIGNNAVTTRNKTTNINVRDTAETGKAQLATNTITLSLRQAHTQADIDDIVIGVGDEDDDDIDIGSEPDPENPDKPYFDENGDVVIYLPDSPEKTVKVNYPTMKTDSEGATVKVATNASKDTRPTLSAFAGNDVGTDGKDVAVEPNRNVIHVQVTPEDGSDNFKYYTITCIFTYVRLSDLAVEADVSDLENADDINNGFKAPEEYDLDTYEYEVYVPGDATEVSATVVQGYGASNEIALTAANCTVENTTVMSGSVFTVSEIGEDATLELKVTAKGGNPDPNTHTYKLTFVAVSTDASLKTIVVKGADLKMEAKNDTDQATENEVDYYYLVVDTDPVQALMTITANDDKATIEVKGSTGEYSNYSPTKKYDPDTYTIRITSEAGNYNEYTVMLTKKDFLKLNDDTDYDYLAMLQEVRNGYSYEYRVNYSYLGWKHGLDDIYIDRFYDRLGWRKGVDDAKVTAANFNVTVLGNIAKGTDVETFVQEIDASQRDSIKIYNAANILIYEDNAVKPELLESERLIGTGARVEFGEDVVYCSVLGDVSGDGYIDTEDSSNVVMYYISPGYATEFNNIWIKLAGMIANSGTIDTEDASYITLVYISNGTLEEYYNNYVSSSS